MFQLKIETDNAAFQDGAGPAEIGDILRAVEGKLLNGEREGVCHDVNGNKVGTWRLT